VQQAPLLQQLAACRKRQKLSRGASAFLFGHLLLAFLSIGAMPLSAATVAIHHAESIVVSMDGAAIVPADAARKSPLSAIGNAKRQLKFDAFGRRFALSVTANADLNRFAASRDASAIALRGELEGVENSWVRLTQNGAALRGLIWDGHELYAVEPAADVPEAGVANGLAIFRLRDTVTELGAHACGTNAEEHSSGAAYYQNLRSELKRGRAKASPAGVSHRLLLSAIIDAAFRQQYYTDSGATDALIARVNNMDGIFAAQLGVTVDLTQVSTAESAAATRLSASNSANELLTSLSSVRTTDTTLFGTGVTHLFTGRDLDGSTIGIAYVGAVCGANYGASLSEARGRGAWIDSLIAAHELGHSFGAPHDGAGECVSTPLNFLMAPTIAGYDKFSQCSLQLIRDRMAQAACLVPMPKTDVVVAANLGNHQATVDQDFVWSLSVANLTDTVTQTVQVQIAIPAAVRVSAAATTNGSCSIGAGVAECMLNAMTPQEVRSIELSMRGALPGAFDISADASAGADFDLTNNHGVGSITIAALTPAPATSTPQNTPSNTVTAAPAEEGGGAMHYGWLLVLTGFGLLRLPNKKGRLKRRLGSSEAHPSILF